MLVATLPLGWRLTIVLVAGVAAGISNGVAGGGTFITFPTLLGLGVPALRANLSTTVGVVPSSLASLSVFRAQLRPHRRLVLTLAPACVVGSATGTALLLNGSPSTFRLVVPWLIGGATVLFAFAPLITRSLSSLEHDHGARRWALYLGIFAVSIYGGYFGAGLGILMISVMALALPLKIHELQGLRNALTLVINVVAAVIFLVHGHLEVGYVLVLLLGTFVGGWLGARLIVRLSPSVVRVLVIAFGVATTVKLAIGA